LIGVISVLPGYAGGTVKNPSYEAVSSGSTGHAEAIQINFDPSLLSYRKILDVFWFTHDPTTLNRQGNDIGTQYRSVVFYHNEEQKQIAEGLKAELEREKKYESPLVTKIIPFTNFYPAEDYHKNYFENHSDASYCSLVISPKLSKLLEKYGSDIRLEYKE
jgi:peptide-methionine (S)-S-oxide reductase